MYYHYPSLQMRKMKYREIKELAQGLTACRLKRQKVNSDSAAATPEWKYLKNGHCVSTTWLPHASRCSVWGPPGAPCAYIRFYPKWDGEPEREAFEQTKLHKTCTHVYRGLICNGQKLEEPKCPCIGDWLNNLRSILTMEHRSAIKRVGSERVTASCVSVVGGLFWADSNQDPAGSREISAPTPL